MVGQRRHELVVRSAAIKSVVGEQPRDAHRSREARESGSLIDAGREWRQLEVMKCRWCQPAMRSCGIWHISVAASGKC